nr:uncharacterized protein LOC108190180 [Danio rerio]XP_021332030.1 uncharacterized protein LOC108190180 [Danio rerio]|eukprot:XP_021329714.1 uncharacterized protein LOC108190180 [Danio rerio]
MHVMCFVVHRSDICENMKRAKVEIEGYLHSVSAICEGSDNKYFTALIQEADRNTRMVIFDLQRHDVFQNAEKDRTPVKLCNVQLSPSRYRSGETDIIFNSGSTLSCVRHLNFVFDESCRVDVRDVTLKEIVENGREYQRVNIKVKVLQFNEARDAYTRTSQKMMTRCYEVADVTNSMSLTVWGGEVLNVAKWYALTNVSVRKFGGCKCLSTTAQSTITACADNSMAVAEIRQNFETKEGIIVTADVKMEYFCPKRHALLKVNLETSVTRCHQCDACCHTSRIVAALRGNITIEEKCGKMNNFGIDDFLMRKLLNISNESTPDPDALVAMLLGDGSASVQVKFRGQRVIDVVFVKKSTNALADKEESVMGTSHDMGECSELFLEELFSEDQSEEVTQLNTNVSEQGSKMSHQCDMSDRVGMAAESSKRKTPRSKK